MATITKKKIKEIEGLTLYDKILKNSAFGFTERPPAMWCDEETKMFDMMTSLEYELKLKILEIINRKK